MSKKPNYQASLDELQTIIRDMESGKIPVDQLSANVKRAAELIKICKNILNTTEEDVSTILAELDNDRSEDRQD